MLQGENVKKKTKKFNYYFRDGVPSRTFSLHITKEQIVQLRTMYNVSSEKDCEWLALGDIKISKRGVITVSEFYIPKQVSNQVHCQVVDEETARLIQEQKQIRFWFHTHPNMGAFWSKEDCDTSDRLAQTADCFLSLVIGKNHKMRAKFHVKAPRKRMYDLSINIENEIPRSVISLYEREFSSKVREEKIRRYRSNKLRKFKKAVKRMFSFA